MAKNVQEMLGVSMDKIKEMVDVNMVIGDAISLPGNVTVVPISKITYGFAAGGTDWPNKANRDIFGGGSGAGINVIPLALLIVTNGDVRVVPINEKPDSIDRAISMVPEVIDKVKDFFKKDKSIEEGLEGEQVSEIVIE